MRADFVFFGDIVKDLFAREVFGDTDTRLGLALMSGDCDGLGDAASSDSSPSSASLKRPYLSGETFSLLAENF